MTCRLSVIAFLPSFSAAWASSWVLLARSSPSRRIVPPERVSAQEISSRSSVGVANRVSSKTLSRCSRPVLSASEISGRRSSASEASISREAFQ